MLAESVFTLSTLTKAVNSATLLLLLYGLWNRHRPRRHIPVMLTCFAVDLVNVVVVELNTRAVEQGLESVGSGSFSLLNFHIFVSVIMLVCYCVAVITGVRLYRKGIGRAVHRRNAVVFLIARVANYVTSFFV